MIVLLVILLILALFLCMPLLLAKLTERENQHIKKSPKPNKIYCEPPTLNNKIACQSPPELKATTINGNHKTVEIKSIEIPKTFDINLNFKQENEKPKTFWDLYQNPEKRHVAQIVLEFVITAFAVGCAAQLLFFHDFIPSEKTLFWANVITVCLVGLICLVIFNLIRKRLWQIPKKVENKNIMPVPVALVFFPLMLAGFIWLPIAALLPQFYTSIYGDERVIISPIEINKNTSRYACTYKMRPIGKHYDSIFFYYCVSENIYSMKGDSSLEFAFIFKSSPLGMKLESVDLASFWRLIKQLHPEKNIIDIENKKER